MKQIKVLFVCMGNICRPALLLVLTHSVYQLCVPEHINNE